MHGRALIIVWEEIGIWEPKLQKTW